MSRIKKRGLDYFPLNTDFIHDRLVRRIMKREGDGAFAILLSALSCIYADEGYYVHADELFYEDLSACLYQQSADDVKRILALAVEYGVFHAGLFSQYGILTSAEIQRQYLFSTKRRKLSCIDPLYCLLPDNATEDEEAEKAEKAEETEKAEKAEEAEKAEAAEKTKKTEKTEKTEATENTENAKTTGNTEKAAAGTLPAASAESAATPAGNAPTAKARTTTGQNVTFKPQNVTSGTHSIAQHSIAQHSIAQQSTKNPLLKSSPEAGGTEDAAVPSAEEEYLRKIELLQPPHDGVKRNLDGLMLNLRQFRIPPREQYAIILKSNYGAIGHPVWKGFFDLRDSRGKIRQPGHYLLSLCVKKRLTN